METAPLSSAAPVRPLVALRILIMPDCTRISRSFSRSRCTRLKRVTKELAYYLIIAEKYLYFRYQPEKAKNILPRFGAIGGRGSIAVMERFHRTLKKILRLSTMEEDQAQFERKVDLAIAWYNEHRPHENAWWQDAERGPFHTIGTTQFPQVFGLDRGTCAASGHACRAGSRPRVVELRRIELLLSEAFGPVAVLRFEFLKDVVFVFGKVAVTVGIDLGEEPLPAGFAGVPFGF